MSHSTGTKKNGPPQAAVRQQLATSVSGIKRRGWDSHNRGNRRGKRKNGKQALRNALRFRRVSEKSASEPDTDLARIKAAWPALPEPIRLAIVALIDAAFQASPGKSPHVK
jgi:hypothetical protein